MIYLIQDRVASYCKLVYRIVGSARNSLTTWRLVDGQRLSVSHAENRLYTRAKHGTAVSLTADATLNCVIRHCITI